MQRKAAAWKPKGMNRDLSVSAFSSEFVFENRNLRLSTNESNTLMSWVNERSTAEISVSINTKPWLPISEQNPVETSLRGVPIGTAVINHKLVVFTTWGDGESGSESLGDFEEKDFIYVLWYNADETSMNGKRLYCGNLEFSTEHPIETLVYVESTHIQKVYWTDGLNQPRAINIAASKETLRLWSLSASPKSLFNFVPVIALNENMTVTKNQSGGWFAPGVIQYCFTYVSKNGQESNIVKISPLEYLAHEDRGASPEEHVNISFIITLDDLDTNFSFVRLYSIHRTSLNADPIVKLLGTLSYSNSVTFTDSGTVGSTVDPYMLLYIGGKEISAQTIADKDNTLFLGNIVQTSPVVNDVQEYMLNDESARPTIHFVQDVDGEEPLKTFQLNHTESVFYGYTSMIASYNQEEITTFKGGETYRFGFQLQTEYGEWTEPIFIGDEENLLYPNTKLHSDTVKLVYAKSTIPLVSIWNSVGRTDLDRFRKIRPVIVYPSMYDRSVVCQGVLNPTVFNIEDRTENKPFAQASWYFRPNVQNCITVNNGPTAVENIGKIVTEREFYDTEPSFSVDVPSGMTYSEISVLVMDFINGDAANQILSTKRIPATVSHYTQDTEDQYVPFLYAVNLSTPDRPYRFAIGGYDTNQHEHATYDENIVVRWAEGTLYGPGLHMASSKYHIYYYKKQVYGIPDLPDIINTQIKVLFNTNWQMYTMHYTAIEAVSIDVGTDYTTFYDASGELQGSNIPFKHYDYLYPTEPEDFFASLSKGPLCEDPSDPTSTTITLDARIDISSGSALTIPGTYKMTLIPSNNKVKYAKMTLYFDDSTSTVVPTNNSYSTFSLKYTNSVKYTVPDTGENGKKLDHIGFAFSIYKNGAHPAQMPVAPFEATWEVSLVGIGSQKIYSHSTEIQNTEIIYKTPYEEPMQTLDSNTEFFVDQSIVTLNSPDLEYDIELQGYYHSGMKLRIIGAIPVTATASSHQITSTEMLPTWKNNDPKGGDIPHVGAGESLENVYYGNTSFSGGKKLVSELLWNDVLVRHANNNTTITSDLDSDIKTSTWTWNFMVFPWQRSGSLNNDWRSSDLAKSILKTKKESNYLYSLSTCYFPDRTWSCENLTVKYHLQENEYIYLTDLGKQLDGLRNSATYYANIDKALTHTENDEWVTDYDDSHSPTDSSLINDPEATGGRTEFNELVGESVSSILLKYKSNTHAVIAMQHSETGDYTDYIPVLPSAKNEYFSFCDCGLYYNENNTTAYPFWDATSGVSWNFKQESLDLSDIFGYYPYSFLWLGELYCEGMNKFGGSTKDAIKANLWTVGGKEVDLQNLENGNIDIYWTIGDTYYQRYDCLKTYPYTTDDPNQLVEILSFLCETRVNIDGRFDANRGKQDSYSMSPFNFGSEVNLNGIYSQRDNFFTYQAQFTDLDSSNNFPNWITYTNTKTPGEDVDAYTHISLASVLSLDGNKGDVTSLRRFNDQIIAFQERGISQILYNENVQIASTSGVPIEIANSGKVQGARYISNTVGCSNKWSIAESPAGLYFMDSEGKNLWMFNGQLANLSQSKGFNSWFKARIPKGEITWNPLDFDNFVSYYDYLNQEMHFINKEESLVFSERVGEFTSFYDYGNTPYFCNLDSTGIWIRQDATIWKHQGGNTYGKFFGKNKDYSTTIVANPDAIMDKLFTNMEFRASMQGEGTVNSSIYTPFTPFDSIEAWNEYQHGKNGIVLKNGVPAMQHYEGDNNPLKRKFRIWRCDIPRDNYPVPDTKEGVSRFSAHPMDRMRNPWLYLKLQKEAAESGSLPKMELHDLLMYYYLT